MNKGGRPALKIENQHSVAELRNHYRACTCAVERRRTQVLWWLTEGRSRKEVLELSAYSNSSLVEVIQRYNEYGLEGLKDRRHENPGAPSLLSDEELLLLAQVVRKDYRQGRVWNGQKVVTWLREELGKELHVSRAYEALAPIGFSPQLPRPAHSKAHELEQEHFKKILPEAVKLAKERYETVELWTMDEHRIGLKPILRRVWAPRGQRPVIATYPRYEWLYLYAFVQPETGQTIWYILPEMNTRAFQAVLDSFARAVESSLKKRILLVLDNASSHTSSKLVPRALKLFFNLSTPPNYNRLSAFGSSVTNLLLIALLKTLTTLSDG